MVQYKPQKLIDLDYSRLTNLIVCLVCSKPPHHSVYSIYRSNLLYINTYHNAGDRRISKSNPTQNFQVKQIKRYIPRSTKRATDTCEQASNDRLAHPVKSRTRQGLNKANANANANKNTLETKLHPPPFHRP